MRGKPIIYRHRIGWLALAVLPLFAIGIGATYAGYDMEYVKPGSVKAGAGWALMTLGGFVVLVSAAALSMRWDLVIDRPAGQIRRTRGCLGMNRSYAFDLASFNRVEVYLGMVHNPQGSSYQRYRVAVAGEQLSVYVTEYSDLARARKEADRLGQYLDFPVNVEKGL